MPEIIKIKIIRGVVVGIERIEQQRDFWGVLVWSESAGVVFDGEEGNFPILVTNHARQ